MWPASMPSPSSTPAALEERERALEERERVFKERERAHQLARGLGAMGARSPELIGATVGAVGGATLAASQFLARLVA